ncbi:MAG: DUF2314 domain-containing protein [Phycisphaeraceae bacterium]|nr:DUF2314 domain-containing protein [Phycisphaeraceae bacterium]MCW5755368.1 DUF2314 domain-containing protein [Phycisphaeraceae bacterium]
MVYAIVGGVVVLVVLAVWFVRRRRSRGTNSGPVSVVVFRTCPAHLNTDIVQSKIRDAFDKSPEIAVHDLPGGGGKAYSYVADGLPPIAVIDCQRPYFPSEEVAETVARLEDERARDAIRRHQAWISVDVFGLDGAPDDLIGMMQVILGKLAAEFIDANALMIFLPHRGLIAIPDAANVARLKEAKFDEVFRDSDLHQPMYTIDASDQEIEKAMKAARTRLPEFLSAFETHGAACNPMFKARFTTSEGGVECIWCSLRTIEAGELSGIIENRPVDRAIPRKGSQVRVNLDDVVDWMYLDASGEPQGMFVDRVLVARG